MNAEERTTIDRPIFTRPVPVIAKPLWRKAADRVRRDALDAWRIHVVLVYFFGLTAIWYLNFRHVVIYPKGVSVVELEQKNMKGAKR